MDHLRVSTFGNDTGNVSRRDLRRSGTLAMILGGLFPPIGAFFTTLPDCVLGGCTVIMFGSIMMSGIRMMQNAGLDQRNVLIAATSLCLGVGVTRWRASSTICPRCSAKFSPGTWWPVCSWWA